VKQVLVRGGAAVVVDVSAPTVRPRGMLVRDARSCVSPGTERGGIELSMRPLCRRALKQPEQAKRVFDRARSQLLAGLPLGYSASRHRTPLEFAFPRGDVAISLEERIRLTHISIDVEAQLGGPAQNPRGDRAITG
jgi:hypothetical protein